jgi:hypothetical protein
MSNSGQKKFDHFYLLLLVGLLQGWRFTDLITKKNNLLQELIFTSCAAIAQQPELFAKVVPTDQTFSADDYAGVFHFRFWIYGIWHDVGEYAS